jgi:hypothetical protein
MYTADGVEHKTFSIKADYIRKIDLNEAAAAADAFACCRTSI